MEKPQEAFSGRGMDRFCNPSGLHHRKEKMKEHLEQGCKRCSKIVSLWQRVQQTAETEANYRPPSDAVRVAKASFAGSNLTEEQKRPHALAEMLFNSLLQPLLDGI